MIFRFYTEDLMDVDVLSMDGLAPKGLNLSHWPGNRTPDEFKADTSTEMALKFMKSQSKNRYLNGLEIVTNNHYDTDGFLSIASILYPELSIENEGLLIDTATTGDFSRFTSHKALKFDLTVSCFSSSHKSPLYSQIQDLPEAPKRQILYDTLLDLYPKLLSEMDTYSYLWDDEYHLILTELEELKNGTIRVENYQDMDLGVVYASKKLHLVTLCTATPSNRILLITHRNDGFFYEFQYTVDSWFDLLTRKPLPRLDLKPLAMKLNDMESDSMVLWAADPITYPRPTLSPKDPQGKKTMSYLSSDRITQAFMDYFTNKCELDK
ncbi:MAG: hypothetical protein IEMM0008_0009 [bacterium]|nr:MAG: hypothetical protein IEMM0008_0009 [bacterium]